jgi:alkylation response protein AidB-like acyl-CoA dehydrogenase
MFFPAADAEVIDTWDAAGLRGTGSHDYAVTDVFVPAERSLSFREPPVESGPLYALPLIAYGSLCVAAVPLGIARHAIDVLAELAGVKTSSASRTLLREHALGQRDLGRAEALVGAGRAYLYQTLDEAWQTVCAGRALSDQQRARLWLAGTHATTCAIEAVDLMFSAGGATAVYATSPLERCLRTAAQHITVVPDNYLMAGQALLGLDMSPTRLYNDHRGEA